jgi:hypothetical protein
MARLKNAEKDFIERVLTQCAYSLGCGAQMPISGQALLGIMSHCRGDVNDVEKKPGFAKALYGFVAGGDDSDKGEARWAVSKAFILDCCVEIGRRAAESAMNRGAVRIDRDLDLKPAYNFVSKANTGPVAGDYCPNWAD